MMEKNIKYILMCAAIPTSLALVGGDKASAADVQPAGASETSVVSNEVPGNKNGIISSECATAPTNEATCNPATKKNNIISEGGHVNVEGKNATLSADKKSVVFSYTVAFQRMHSSDHGQTVSDVGIRIPKIPNSKIDFTLIGTRDSNGNPISVNVPMKEVNNNETASEDPYAYDTPTAEELAAGKTPYVVKSDDSDESFKENQLVSVYNLYTNFNKSQAVQIDVTVPFEWARKIKYLPIDARMFWKASKEGGIQGYESGAQHLEEYDNHAAYTNRNSEELGGLGNPSSIDDSYVSNGNLIKSVSNPSTHITPNNGDWTSIPEDTNIDKNKFFHYAEIFSLRANPAVTYYVSEKEDMADQDVSTLYQGDVKVDYVIKGTNNQLKETYKHTDLMPIYDSKGKLIKYSIEKNSAERPQKITVDGKNYVLVGISPTSDAESGELKDGTVHVVYEYVLETEVAPKPETPATPEKPETKPTPTPDKVKSKQPTKHKVVKVNKVDGEKQLPKTGVTTSTGLLGLTGIFVVAGLLLRLRKQK